MQQPITGDPGFRGPQVCSIVGITYRQLDYWARTNLLRPSIADAKGSGSQRRYSYGDLLELKVIKKLLDAGVSLSSARAAVTYLRGHLGEDLASANLVIDGETPLLVSDDGDIVDLVRNGQGVLKFVPLKIVKDALDAAIFALLPDHPASDDRSGSQPGYSHPGYRLSGIETAAELAPPAGAVALHVG